MNINEEITELSADHLESIGGGTQQLGVYRPGFLHKKESLQFFRSCVGDDIDAVRDELIADAVGLYAAFGRFDPEKEKLFLGIKDSHYIGGRLENYTPEPEKMIDSVIAELDRMKNVIDVRTYMEPFTAIRVLMKKSSSK